MSDLPAVDATRRSLLRHLFLTAGAVSTPAWVQACGGDSAIAAGEPTPPLMGDSRLALQPGPLANIGPLVDAGIDNMLIPEGFTARVVARHRSNPVTGTFDPLGASGYVWHEAPDGGAVFPAPDGGWVYVSNSERGIGTTSGSSRDGGVGALRFNADGEVVDAYRILDGTRRNCAGGATPWHTWISCEETGDGYAWECFPFGGVDDARRLDALGQFNKEAAAVDLPTRTVYQTEDAGNGRFYRFVCDESDLVSDVGQPRLQMARGRLQVLNVEGFEDDGYIADDAEARTLRRVHWVDVVQADQPQGTVRNQLADAGEPIPGTQFRGGEGLWIHPLPAALQAVPPGGRVPTRAVAFFACKGDNRVYAYDIDNDLIQTIFDNAAIDPAFDDVDNVVVSPAGDVLVAEDGDAMRLMVLVPGGAPKVLMQITSGGSEITGPAFTPDGSRLYFSSQRGPTVPLLRTGTGATYEITIPEAFRT